MTQLNDRPRDASRTGETEAGGSGVTWYQMKTGDGIFYNKRTGAKLAGISGYLDSVEVQFEEEVPAHEIPYNWSLTLTLSMCENTTWYQAKVSIGSTKISALSAVMNCLLAAPNDWDNWMRLFLYKSDESDKSARLSVYVLPGLKGPQQPHLYEWDSSVNRLLGEPAKIEFPGPAGKKTYDALPVELYWLEHVPQLFQKLTGDPFDISEIRRQLIMKRDPQNSYGLNATNNPPVQQPVRPPQNVTPPADPKQQFWDVLEKNFAAVTPENYTAKANAAISAKQKYGIGDGELLMRLNDIMGRNLPGYYVDNKLMLQKKPAAMSEPTVNDDLPF